MSNTGAAIAPSDTKQERSPVGGQWGRVIVAFICENCARSALMPTSALRRRPTTPDFAWPIPVREVVVPCAGRLQPEHFLKVFEDGADAIGVFCCEEGNCHHLEGNRRCTRRLAHVNDLLEQIGLGANRLMIFNLPGSAMEDMAMGNGATPMENSAMQGHVATVRKAFLAGLATIPPNPMRQGELPDASPYEVDNEDESDE